MPDDHPWLFEPDAELGKFRLMRRLGKGGMAEVYLARDTELGRKVAIKVIRRDVAAEQESVDRFLFEARATAKFSHPNIVQVHEVGGHEGHPYVVLEYVEGETLRERLAHEPPSAIETMRIGVAVAQALAVAHNNGIQHRDLKPENIILGRDGRLRVLDFGMAQTIATRDNASFDELVATQLDPIRSMAKGIRGSPAYMAPEQWQRAQTTGTVDVWALGVILYELLAGRRPFEAETAMDVAVKVCGDAEAPRVDEGHRVPSDLVRLVADCLNKDPTERPTAAYVAETLQRMLTGDRERATEEQGPFRGLLPFTEEHAGYFFGREAEIAACNERLRTEPVLAVVGPSGAGKSSFVSAGVVPRLRERGPLVVLRLRPGRDPFQALANRVVAARKHSSEESEESAFGVLADTVAAHLAEGAAGPNDEADNLASKLYATPHLLNVILHRLAAKRRASVVLFVDQLEELFTLVPDQEMQQRFVQAICTAADDPEMPVRVLMTLREEFFSRLGEGAGLRGALTQVMSLRSPGESALRDILRRPVEAVGYGWEDAQLIDEMLAAVKGEAACLPLLQFAGERLWRERDRTRQILLRSAHDAMGGVPGALVQHADGVLAGMTAEEVSLARTILLRMVTPEKTRRALTRTALLEGLGSGADEVLKRLVASRLVVGHGGESEGELELAHESLVVTWDRLARWIDESREELVVLDEVGRAAELWEKRGRRDAELWQGDALRDADRALEHCTSEIPSQAQRFIEAGQRRARRFRMRQRASVLLAATALAGAALFFALKERETRDAERRASAERDRAREHLGQALAKRAMASRSVHDATLFAAAALTYGEDPEARGILAERALEWRPRLLWQVSSGGRLPRGSMAFLPDGSLLVGTSTGRLRIYDRETGQVLGAIDALSSTDGGEVLSFDVSFDGSTAVTGASDGSVRSTVLASGVTRSYQVEGQNAQSLALSPDGAWIAVAGGAVGRFDPTARIGGITLLELADGGRRALPAATRGAIIAAAISPDGELLAYTSFDKKVYLWDRNNPEQSRPAWELLNIATTIGFSPDGTMLAIGGYQDAIRVGDPATGAILWELKGHWAEVVDLHMSPDSRMLASASVDTTVRVWDTTSGVLLSNLEHGGPVAAVAFDSAGTRLATGTRDGRVRVWDLEGGSEVDRLVGHEGKPSTISFSRDGRTLHSTGMDRSLRHWNLATGECAVQYMPEDIIYRAGTSPDGRYVLVVDTDHAKRVVGMADGREVAQIRGDFTLLFENRREGAICVYETPRVDRWDLASGELESIAIAGSSITRVVANEGALPQALSSDDTLLAVTGVSDTDDTIVEIWDLQSGELYRTINPPRGIVVEDLEFSPNDEMIVSAGSGGPLYLWEVRTAELLRELRGHENDATHMVFTPDGRMLVTGGLDNTNRVWDVASGRELARFFGRTVVSGLAISPSGERMAVTRPDNSIRILDLTVLREPADQILEQAIRESGRRVIGASIVPVAEAGRAE